MARYSLYEAEYLNKLFNVRSCQIMHVMAVHVLASCVETGFDSGLGGPCGRLAGVWSELSSLSLRDSWRVSEDSTADADTDSNEDLEGALAFPLFLSSAETLAGSKRHQLRQHALGLLFAMGAYIMTLVATQMSAGSADTYVTGLQEQSDRRLVKHSTFASSRHISPKGIPWLKMLQHLRATLLPNLLSLVSWKNVRGSACEMKEDSMMLRASGQK